jgi:hypothetical protein
LHLLLIFSTGLDEIPPLGFHPKPSLKFAHVDGETLEEGDPRIGFPIANTCSNVLHLPVLNSYNEFKANMLAAISIVQTFVAE